MYRYYSEEYQNLDIAGIVLVLVQNLVVLVQNLVLDITTARSENPLKTDTKRDKETPLDQKSVLQSKKCTSGESKGNQEE